jgi:hypothetical protein
VGCLIRGGTAALTTRDSIDELSSVLTGIPVGQESVVLRIRRVRDVHHGSESLFETSCGIARTFLVELSDPIINII